MNDLMRELTEYAASLEKQALYSAAILRPGKEPAYYASAYAHRCQNVYSVSKTFTAAAVGLAFDRGLLKPADRLTVLLAGEFSETDVLDKRWHEVTVDMLLRHRCGLDWGWLDIDCDPYASFGKDFLAACLGAKLIFDPDSDYAYSDGAYYLLSRAVSRVTGEKMNVFLWRELLAPLKFAEAAWTSCPDGYPMGGTGLYVSTRDLASFGTLYTARNDETLLSREWTELSAVRGYGFDRFSPDGICDKNGMYGQYLLIDRKSDTVFAYESFDGPSKEIAEWFAARL